MSASAGGSADLPELVVIELRRAAAELLGNVSSYADATFPSSMFRDELADLEARYADRLRIVHVRSRDPHHPAPLRGRVDRPKLEQWLGSDLVPALVDEWFLCGPLEMVTDLHELLIERGAEPACVHVELFHGYQKSKVADHFAPATIEVRLSGRQHEVSLAAGDTVLESALKAGLDAPYACLGGACGTCKAKVILGAVAMEQNFALSTADVGAGYVLTCQSHPTTPAVTVDYDA